MFRVVTYAPSFVSCQFHLAHSLLSKRGETARFFRVCDRRVELVRARAAALQHTLPVGEILGDLTGELYSLFLGQYVLMYALLSIIISSRNNVGPKGYWKNNRVCLPLIKMLRVKLLFERIVLKE